MSRIISFLKKQIVLVVAWVLAIISSFFIHPDKMYFSYIDWRSLGILWSLMVIMAAYQLNNVFETIGKWLLGKVQKLWQLVFVLVLLCFFFSMFVTNDVALITFVPFSILILEACNCQKMMIPVIVLQTIAANLGSMLTPIGNPQNLYLFGLGGFSLGSFIKLMFPYSLLSLFLLIGCMIFVSKNGSGIEIGNSADNLLKEKKSDSESDRGLSPHRTYGKTLKLVLFTVLFILSILTVLHVLPFYILVPIVLVFMMIFERKAVAKADYFLLLTFCGFFIFTGNIARIDFINQQLQNFVSGREILCGIIASQVISNVPAALLLSGFSKSLSDLVVGVNLGGLGTLIASMASLISYKFYAASKESKSGKYMIVFTIYNVIFLIVLVLENVILGMS